jgi:hypothetical protein
MLISISVFLLSSTRKSRDYHKNKSKFLSNTELQNGDLIFRKGRSMASHAVVITDQQSFYSHVGLIVLQKNEPFVVHAVPGESENGIDYIKCESVSSFIDKHKASKVAVYRCKEQEVQKLKYLSQKALSLYKKRLIFDDDYNLESNNKLYCTELVWKLYKQIGVDLIDNHFDELSLPVVKGKYILPGNFIKSEYLFKVYAF